VTRIAGLDIGNTTTELVVVETGSGRPELVAHHNVRTVGSKGSDASIQGAARLVRRANRQGAGIERIHVAPLRPVRTTVATCQGPRTDGGPLRVLATHAATPANSGFGVGTPVDVRAEPIGARCVLLVPAEVGYQDAARLIGRHHAVGALIAAVLVARDEAVLLANRLDFTIPILDGVDLDDGGRWLRVAVEVAQLGQAITALSDPHRVAVELGVDALDPALNAMCTALDGASCAAVAVGDEQPRGPRGAVADWVRFAEIPGEAVGLIEALPMLGGDTPRRPVAVRWAGDTYRVDDFFGVDVHATSAPFARPDATLRPGTVAAAMLSADPAVDVADALQCDVEIPVETAASETDAARMGALTTPGASRDSVVVDLGGGTMDVIAAEASHVLAGCGQLVTAAVGAALGIPNALAEWVKRAPSTRIESSYVAITEDGRRTFLDGPARADTVGHLVVDGPAGAVPFTDRFEPQQWAALRRELKAACLGRAAARAGVALTSAPDVIAVGGPAADPEILWALRRCLPREVTVGRGSVATRLGTRYAVAYGLASCA
jgi:hypothetical protein